MVEHLQIIDVNRAMKKLTIIVHLLFISITICAQQGINVFEQELFTQIPNARDISISLDESELYFTAQSIKQDFSAIMVSKKKVNVWQKPEVASFSGQYKDIEPFLSQDGLVLYFSSNRAVKGREEEKSNYDIWKVERKSLGATWSTPINLGAPVNTEADEFYPSVANNGNMYFTATLKNGLGKEDIFISEYSEGVYASPTPLSDSINSTGYEFNAFVAPDESYLIFTGYRREGGLGRGDLYLSKKDKQGDWQVASHFEIGINSAGIDYCPFVQNGILYFTSDRSAIKPNYENSLSTSELIVEFNQVENGKSRIYSVKWPELDSSH